jgi:hypothetical protein
MTEHQTDAEAIVAGRASLDEDGGIPLEVDTAISGGVHPIDAWLAYRGMSRQDLATVPGGFTPYEAIAKALNAPLWTILPR